MKLLLQQMDQVCIYEKAGCGIILTAQVMEYIIPSDMDRLRIG